MTQTAPNRHRQPVAWADMQGTRVPLQRPANDNRRPRRGRPALLWLAGVLALGAVVLLLLTRI